MCPLMRTHTHAPTQPHSSKPLPSSGPPHTGGKQEARTLMPHVPVQNTHESQICPFILPIKIRLKELLVTFPCVRYQWAVTVVICGVQQCFRFLSTRRKRCLTNQCVRKIKTRVPLKNHTPHGCHFSMSLFRLQGCFLPYFVDLCSLLDIKLTRCFHFLRGCVTSNLEWAWTARTWMCVLSLSRNDGVKGVLHRCGLPSQFVSMVMKCGSTIHL